MHEDARPHKNIPECLAFLELINENNFLDDITVSRADTSATDTDVVSRRVFFCQKTSLFVERNSEVQVDVIRTRV